MLQRLFPVARSLKTSPLAATLLAAPSRLASLRALVTQAAVAMPITPSHCHPLRLTGLKQPLRQLNDSAGNLKYILRQPHIHGGFGEVSHATNLLGELLVGKEVRVLSDLADPVAQQVPRPVPLKKIQQEIMAQQILGSTGGPVEVLRAGDTVFIMMAAGCGDLDRLYRQAHAAKLPPSDFRVLMRSALAQIAAELASHHAKSFVHGDIKLANAIYDDSGSVRLIDFGATQPASGKTGRVRPGQRGTPGFMAPENASRGDYGAPADLWSLFLTACDFWAPRDINPFLLRPNAAPVYTGLQTWRTRQGLDHGAEPDYAMRPDPCGFGNYFGRVAQHEPELAAFGLQKLLVEAPAQRASAGQFAALMRQLQPEDSIAERRARKLFAQLADNDTALQEARADLSVGLLSLEEIAVAA